MTFLLYVDVPLAHAEAIQFQIEQCCAERGDQLIGRRVYEDIEEVLLVIQLMDDTHYTPHVKVLGRALQARQILSFQSENTHLVRLQCDHSQRIRPCMCGFPLHASESWFPSIADERTAYLCARTILIKRDQERWMDERQLHYQYI